MKLIKHIKYIIIRYLIIRKLKQIKYILEDNNKLGYFVGLCYIINEDSNYYFYNIIKFYLESHHKNYLYDPTLYPSLNKVKNSVYWFPTRSWKAANQVRIDYINYLITNINTLLPITLTNLNNLKNK